jgi:sporulation protein YlmC with PRC-barrel domain
MSSFQSESTGEKRMLKPIATAALLGFLTVSVFAAQESTRLQTSIPANALTVTDWYKQDVYDPSNSKIGQITDVLVDKSGKISTLIIGVGGFLGVGEKEVAVPFEEVQATTRDNKIHLVMNATKDVLKSAPAFKYDSTTTTWVPDKR